MSETIISEDIDTKKDSKMRQIIIETDGNSIHLVAADVSGKIELIGILEQLAGYLRTRK